ncbi:MAG: heparan-alpha-glucosaminide N-acetyltransferase domain-containing protein [Melioribacteraceae bacterium]|nr:heparan-alpha-glucosaminide N-acetyltransferase domain-containing protein [Melioribacteraceae bacterium]MCF8264993.1 heparan-alpha-glucosaminide N-acetyltransferase domain-containing protein [Melioribacteraceae bacterium]MCF8414263.1 heparan-alpha-glucosaminide N-acetyltransferase domain-containing protein [Melioribacteraceae bacterium]MCF8431474.1 heparan-alpha-glucosaminide N-acetyltransferase domain-containing protein [Melioribacteraceae bacterium]
MKVNQSQRLISLDVFRGITIAGMILVNNPGDWGNIYPALRHAEWNGCTPTDLVFPFFLFIVGVAITFSLSKRKNEGESHQKLIKQIFQRSIILFVLGLILNTFPYFELDTIRIPGVLQRIAVVYLVSSILFLKTAKQTQLWIGIGLLLLYWLLMTIVPVPGIGPANLEPATNLGAWLDNLLLGGHLWNYSKVWDPEGILSTVPAISTTILGILAGHLLRSEKNKTEKTVWMFFYGSILMVAGYILDMWFPINKSLWTSSYVLYTGGLALNFLAFCYWTIDVLGYKKWALPFQVYGSNAITVYMLSSLVAIGMGEWLIQNSSNSYSSLQQFLYQNMFLSWLDPVNASLFWALFYVLIWLGIMWIFYKKRIFIKV